MQVYVEHLFTYGAAGRPLLDTRVKKMPYNVAYLGESCWKVVRHYLCPMTKLCPPNHCQVFVYNSKLNSSMVPHKDNGYKKEDGKLTSNTSGERHNSHIFGTEVMIVTIGDPMNFYLIPPPSGYDHTLPYSQHVKMN